MAQEPTRLRRLTKAEAQHLGVKHTAKNYVNADLKRITKRTRLFSQRQAVKAQKGITKEAYTATRQKHVKFGTMYFDVRRKDWKRIIKKARGRQTQILAFGDSGKNNYKLDDGQKFSASATLGRDELEEMLEALYSDEGLGGENLPGYDYENPPDRIDIRVYHTEQESEKLKTKSHRSKHDRRRGK